MNDEIKEQIKYHYEMYLKALDDAEKSQKYADIYGRDPSNIALAGQLSRSAVTNKNIAFNELKILKTLEYSNCAHLWYLSSDKKNTTCPLFCVKCGLSYVTPKAKKYPLSSNMINEVIGHILYQFGVKNYTEFKEYALSHGTYLNDRKSKIIVESIYNTIIASNSNITDEFIVEYINKLYIDYLKKLPIKTKDGRNSK